MAALLLKLLLTPALVTVATLVGRRWGGRVAGWLVGFPFTSGPIALILTLEQGRGFAAAAALGTLLGTASQAAFALAYGLAAGRGHRWPLCLAGATAAFAAGTALLYGGFFQPVQAAVLVVASAAVAVLLLPRIAAPGRRRRPPRFDLAARIVIATSFVLVLTSAASLLGPRLSGLVTPFPLYASVLAVFAQRSDGPAAGLAVVRGLAAGLFGFASFFLVLTVTLVPLGTAVAFSLAILCVGAVQAATLLALRWGR